MRSELRLHGEGTVALLALCHGEPDWNKPRTAVSSSSRHEHPEPAGRDALLSALGRGREHRGRRSGAAAQPPSALAMLQIIPALRGSRAEAAAVPREQPRSPSPRTGGSQPPPAPALTTNRSRAPPWQTALDFFPLNAAALSVC